MAQTSPSSRPQQSSSERVPQDLAQDLLRRERERLSNLEKARVALAEKRKLQKNQLALLKNQAFNTTLSASTAPTAVQPVPSSNSVPHVNTENGTAAPNFELTLEPVTPQHVQSLQPSFGGGATKSRPAIERRKKRSRVEFEEDSGDAGEPLNAQSHTASEPSLLTALSDGFITSVSSVLGLVAVGALFTIASTTWTAITNPDAVLATCSATTVSTPATTPTAATPTPPKPVQNPVDYFRGNRVFH